MTAADKAGNEATKEFTVKVKAKKEDKSSSNGSTNSNSGSGKNNSTSGSKNNTGSSSKNNGTSNSNKGNTSSGNNNSGTSGSSSNNKPQQNCTTVWVQDSAAWDETVVDQAAWDETVIDNPAYDVVVCLSCGAEFNANDFNAWYAHLDANPNCTGSSKTRTIPAQTHIVHHDAITHVVHHEATGHYEQRCS